MWHSTIRQCVAIHQLLSSWGNNQKADKGNVGGNFTDTVIPSSSGIFRSTAAMPYGLIENGNDSIVCSYKSLVLIVITHLRADVFRQNMDGRIWKLWKRAGFPTLERKEERDEKKKKKTKIQKSRRHLSSGGNYKEVGKNLGTKKKLKTSEVPPGGMHAL